MTKEEWIVNAKGSLDLPGSLLYALAMIAIMVGLSEVMTLAYAKYLLAAGLLLFLAFLYGEWHRKSPVLPIRIFAGNRVFSCSSLAAMLNYCATFGISFLLSIYLQRITGLNARDTGLVLLIQPVLMALLSPVTGAPVGPYQSSRPGFFRHDFDYLWPLSLSGGCLLPFFLAHRPGPSHHRHRLCPVHGTE